MQKLPLSCGTPGSCPEDCLQQFSSSVVLEAAKLGEKLQQLSHPRDITPWFNRYKQVKEVRSHNRTFVILPISIYFVPFHTTQNFERKKTLGISILVWSTYL